jgi:hypothetical protein
MAAAVVLVVALCPGGQVQAQGFSDPICPQATQYVLAIGKLHKDDPPQRVYDAAQAATDAYERCSKEKLSNAFREAQHYADTRAGQFAVLAARSLAALNRPDDARKELQHWRPLVQQVIDWQAETETTHDARKPADGETIVAATGSGGSGVHTNDKRASIYRGLAKDVVVAMDAELAKLAEQRDVVRPQVAPTPAH